MARHEHTAEQFESIANDLAKAIETINATVATMREAGMPHALVHGSSPKNQHLPAVLDWIEKVNAEVKMQARAYLSGVASQAELLKQKSDNQKAAAAKKPWKKAAKKKAE
ncbi:hypothetical protein [Schlesneria paludicola]|uniref:hypothetical protein n=1 Tax=Schlesneria paludicola TaxID=360056 RepID=UPI00029AE9A2|nr:hypothetical protein [Schlesneria paludicola]